MNVAQGKITVPGMDDGEECQAMDVSLNRTPELLGHFCLYPKTPMFFHRRTIDQGDRSTECKLSLPPQCTCP